MMALHMESIVMHIITEFTSILPLCNRIICRDKLRPMPLPSFLVVKKGTNILSRTSVGIPRPLSCTSIKVFPSLVLAVLISIVGFSTSLAASIAFLSKLMRACCICPESKYAIVCGIGLSSTKC